MLPIHHTFGPLVTRSQWWKACALQYMPWQWKNGPQREELRSALQQFWNRDAALFSSGREALLATLHALNLQQGEEVIIQGYTCVVVPNAIHAAGGVPIFVDINENSLNLEPAKVREAITPQTRAIICQHTFGIPADTSALRMICNEHELALIEDCAHTMPTEPSEIGQHGDVIIVSFGRDKAISGVTGGAALSQHEVVTQQLRAREKTAKSIALWNIYNLISYPLRYQCAKQLWTLRCGKLYLKLLQILGGLPAILTKKEKRGIPSNALHTLPNGCAALALQQLSELNALNTHRKEIASIYWKAAQEQKWNIPKRALTASAPQKVPLLVSNAQEIRQALKEQEIYLDDGWTSAVVNPKTVDGDAIGYIPQSCPVAERVAKTILSLPCHPTMTEQQARRVVEALATVMHTTER